MGARGVWGNGVHGGTEHGALAATAGWPNSLLLPAGKVKHPHVQFDVPQVTASACSASPVGP